MTNLRQIHVPRLVRIKPGALARLGLYLQRGGHTPALVLASPLPASVTGKARQGFADAGVTVAAWMEIDGNSFEDAVRLFASIPKGIAAVVGIGGGKALDTAKYLAFLARLPYFAVPTSLSNDGFCSPQASLTVEGRRRSLPAALPEGVIIDVDVVLGAPKTLWLSGVGDLVSKLTAVVDWKLAFHQTQEPVDDLAALLSDATVYQFLAAPSLDAPGVSLLGTALMLNGIAMEICGSSRPASGSEHLVSHALDASSARPRLHGLQVGMATYLMSCLQGGRQSERITGLFSQVGFWDEIRKDPFSQKEWLEAVRLAPGIKDNYFTVLSTRDCLPEIRDRLVTDPHLTGCFV